MSAQRRWICPRCGFGVLGPGRPRRDDTTRYCLDCSAATGRMVARTCPALERERAARHAKQAARTVTARERAAATEIARRTAGPYDLLAEAHRFAKLPALRDKLPRFPEITIRRSATKARSSGRCFTHRNRIVVTVGMNPHDAAEVVLHEMVHAALPSEGHSALFWSTLRRAAREAWPDATFDFMRVRDGWRIDRAIAHGLA